MRISALVPFCDRIAGIHGRRFIGARPDAAVGRGTRLHRDVGCAGHRHSEPRIPAWGAAIGRSDTDDCCRLDRLA